MSTYYIDQIKTYNEEYDSALKKVDNIKTKIESLNTAFSSATGPDIEPIKSDIESLIKKINSLKTKITDAKKSTNTHATNSDLVYDKALNEHKVNTPSFESRDYTYESTNKRNIYIEDGIIYESEIFNQIPKNQSPTILQSLGIVSTPTKYYQSTVYAGVEEMIKGELKLYGAPQKSGEYNGSVNNDSSGGHGF